MGLKDHMAMSKLRLNVLANYAGTLASIICPLIVLPFYLKILGPNIWGLIAFMTTLQVFFSLIDTGVSQALLKEFTISESRHLNNQTETGFVLFGFERLYWCFAFVVAGLVYFFAEDIAQHWLALKAVTVSDATMAIKGAAIIFCFQFPGFIYRSLLLGTQNQVRLNVIVTVSVVIRQLGGIVILMVWPSLLTYIVWHVVCVAVDTFVKGTQAWSVVSGVRRLFAWHTPVMKHYSVIMTKMTFAVLIGSAIIQVDKMILSGMVSIVEFGYYTIASSIATGILQLVYPIVIASIPHVTTFKHDGPRLHAYNFKLLKVMAGVVACGAVGYYLLGGWILAFWLQDQMVANQVQYLLNFLLIGTAVNCIYVIGYMNWIVHSNINRMLFVNITALTISIITIPLFVKHYGVVGAGVGWIVMNLLGLVLSLSWVQPAKASHA